MEDNKISQYKIHLLSVSGTVMVPEMYWYSKTEAKNIAKKMVDTGKYLTYKILQYHIST